MRDFGKSRSNFDPEEETQGGGLANRLVQWLSQQVSSGIAYQEYLNIYEATHAEVVVEKANVAKVVGYHWPNVDLDAEQDNNFIHLWLDSKGRRAGRSGRTMMRVGRAFRRMFPCLTDSEIDGLVTKFKRDFAPISFTLFESKDSDRFAHAYGHEQSRTENLETTPWHKSIANSCMRHEFDHLDCHPASACNGIRCLAKFMQDLNIPTTDNKYKIQTGAGLIVPQMDVDGQVTVDMGKPFLTANEIPTTLGESDRKVVNVPLEVGDKTWNVTTVSMGNPHCMTFVDDVDTIALAEIGVLFEHHAVFPKRTNTEFVEVVNRSYVKMRVWERGAGATLACGTGACATVVAGVLNDLCDRICTVNLPGGDLKIHWSAESDHILMTGPATLVFTGLAENEL